MQATNYFAVVSVLISISLLILAIDSSGAVSSPEPLIPTEPDAHVPDREAALMLRSISDGAFAKRADGVNGTLSLGLDRQAFSASTEITPPLGTCCEGTGTCQSTEATWSASEWKALGFSITGEHRYSYKFSSTGDSFVATAYADFDCDGEFAVVELHGSIGPDGEPIRGAVMVSAGD